MAKVAAATQCVQNLSETDCQNHLNTCEKWCTVQATITNPIEKTDGYHRVDRVSVLSFKAIFLAILWLLLCRRLSSSLLILIAALQNREHCSHVLLTILRLPSSYLQAR